MNSHKRRLPFLIIILIAALGIGVFAYRLIPQSTVLQESRSLTGSENQAVSRNGLVQTLDQMITPTVPEESLDASDDPRESDLLEMDPDEDADEGDVTSSQPQESKVSSSQISPLVTEISAEQAIEIAIREVDESSYVSHELDSDDPPVYEIVVKTDEHYYDVEVLAQTGIVLEVEESNQESDNDSDGESNDDSDGESNDDSEDSSDVEENGESDD